MIRSSYFRFITTMTCRLYGVSL